jgi:iron complex outermembrane recepter protein
VIEVRAAAWAFLLNAATAAAQTPPPSAAERTLPQVTVSPTRSEAAPFDVPASVDVIDGARLRESGRRELQLSESLSIVPGVGARERQN